jgi:hypothetical protein
MAKNMISLPSPQQWPVKTQKRRHPNGKDLSQTLSPTLYAKLKSYFSTMESGVYTIQVSRKKILPASEWLQHF